MTAVMTLPRTGVAVWFVEQSHPATDGRRPARHTAGRVNARRALDELLHAYRVTRLPLGRTCLICGDSHGKPGVAGRFEYSVSHSAEHAVIATSVDHAVGVDIEQQRHWPALPAWVDRLDRRERAAVAAAPSTSKLLDCWTRHEATGKALGCGLAHGLAELGRDARGEDDQARVRVARLAPRQAASACLAVVAPGCRTPTTVHVGRWTASGPILDHVTEAR